jgi:hypothetical protein
MTTRIGNKKPFRTRHPLATLAQAPAGHQTVNMRMQEQCLRPRVQRRDNPGRGSQVLRIPQQGPKRVVDAGKQQLRHDRHIAQPEVIELMGDREDDMIMIAGQQPRLLLGQPPFHLYPGTLGTHPVATGIVPDPFHMAFRTRLDMPTQQGGATHQDRPDRTPDMTRQGMTALIRRIAQLQDRLERDLVGVQALSIAASASLYHACFIHHIPRLCGFVQQWNQRNVVRHIAPYRRTDVPLMAILCMNYGILGFLPSIYCIFPCWFPRIVILCPKLWKVKVKIHRNFARIPASS